MGLYELIVVYFPEKHTYFARNRAQTHILSSRKDTKNSRFRHAPTAKDVKTGLRITLEPVPQYLLTPGRSSVVQM
ncbi:MAG: hypothetical protein K2L16_05030, partial [Muribaculaceae bacterium]|nr:hypothetical protein [Muribaculaceae bacterium]